MTHSRHRRLPLVLLLALLAGASMGSARPTAAAGFGADPVETLLPGPLLAAALVHRADGSIAVAVLVGPPEPPDPPSKDDEVDEGAPPDDEGPRLRSLHLVDPRTGASTILAEGLPETSRRLATLSRSTGTGGESTDGVGLGGRGHLGDLIVVVMPGGARLIDPEDDAMAEPATTSGASSSAGFPLDRATVLAPGRFGGAPSGPLDPLAVARPGELTLVAAAGGAPAVVDRFPLPKRARHTRWGVRITSPEVHRVADDRAEPADPPCWAVGPEAVGKRRLRTLLECLGPDGPAQDPVETWSLLPAEETVTEAVYARYEGRPVLLVLTREKLGLFVKQRLRAFLLEASRTRVGTSPMLAADTVCPLSHDSGLGFADVDGDGRDDLYLVCEKGLVDRELRLEVHRGTGRSAGEIGFDPRVGDVELDGEFGSWLFGRDWTGDGLPDLLAVRDGRSSSIREAASSADGAARSNAEPSRPSASRPPARAAAHSRPAQPPKWARTSASTSSSAAPASSAPPTSTATAAPSSSPTGTASRAACW